MVTADGAGVVLHAGTALLSEMAERVGLTAAFSEALHGLRRRRYGHDSGRVLVDVAVAIADGAETISDVQALADHPDLRGPVASTATIWRVLDGIDAAALARLRLARAQARERAWAARGELTGAELPPARAAGRELDYRVLDGDSTLVTAQSDKEGAAGKFKGGYGFHPIAVWLDNTTRRWFPDWVWRPAITADGGLRDGAAVAEITDLLDLAGWPGGMRVIVRRERPHPGAQLDALEEADGYRYQTVCTNTARGTIRFLEARHRAHVRVEDRIRCGKDTGIGRFPSRELAINAAWLEASLAGMDLLAWTQTMLLDGELAGRAEEAALPIAAHRYPDHPRPTPRLPAAGQELALGPRAGPSVHPTPAHPATHLNAATATRPNDNGDTGRRAGHQAAESAVAAKAPEIQDHRHDQRSTERRGLVCPSRRCTQFTV